MGRTALIHTYLPPSSNVQDYLCGGLSRARSPLFSFSFSFFFEILGVASGCNPDSPTHSVVGSMIELYINTGCQKRIHLQNQVLYLQRAISQQHNHHDLPNITSPNPPCPRPSLHFLSPHRQRTTSPRRNTRQRPDPHPLLPHPLLHTLNPLRKAHLPVPHSLHPGQ